MVGFLHANYPSFVGEQQLEDAAAAADYLSDAGGVDGAAAVLVWGAQQLGSSLCDALMRCYVIGDRPRGDSLGFAREHQLALSFQWFSGVAVKYVAPTTPNPAPSLPPSHCAAYMACHRPATAGGYLGFWGEEDSAASSLTAACASSVAARGLLYANTQPAPHR